MPGTTTSHLRSTNTGINFDQDFTAAGTTDPVKLAVEVAVQITGIATDINATVERSTRDPAGGNANWAQVGDPITGNPSLGIPVALYAEPSAAWWRVRITSMFGAAAAVSLSGRQSS